MHAFLFNSQQHHLKVGVSKTIIFFLKIQFSYFYSDAVNWSEVTVNTFIMLQIIYI